jgi:hypothetical protein
MKIFTSIKQALSNPKTSGILKIAGISLVSGLIIFAGIRYYMSMREKTADPWNYLPENAIAVFQVNNVQDFIQYSGNNPFFSDFEHLFFSSEIQQQILFFDSLFSTKDMIHKEWLEGKLLISIHFSGSDTWDCLFMKPLSHPSERSNVFKFLDNSATNSSETDIQGCNHSRNYVFGKQSYFLCIKEGVCLFSSSKRIVQSALADAGPKRASLSDESLNDVRSTAGKTCMASVFVNYRFLNKYLSGLLNGEFSKNLDFLNTFAGWGAYDIIPGENKIYFTGFTSTKGINNAWLNIFADASPQNIDIASVIPQNTVNFVWMGFDAYDAWRENYKKHLSGNDQIKEFNNNLTNLKNRTSIQNINDLIFPYLDNQYGIFSIPEKGSKNGLQHFAFFKIKNQRDFQKNLAQIMKTTSKAAPDTSTYRNHLIGCITADYMLFDLFGMLFRNIEKTCFVIYEDFWIIGNTTESLKEYLNQVISGRTLAKSAAYAEFSESVSTEASVYLYASPMRMKQSMNEWFAGSDQTAPENISDDFQFIDAVGIQFTTQNSLFLSGITIHRSGSPVEENSSGWEITIEGQAALGPWFADVADHESKNIILFDAFNQMYFISDKGELIWKIPIPERPVGKVWSVDAYKNGKIQYLFGTENNIFLIDMNGKIVEGYPVKLPVQASAPIAVFDYDNTNEYRIIYPGIDKILYNLTVKGEPTKGWEKPSLGTSAAGPAKHVRVVSTDALIIKDSENKIHFFNRRGISMFETDDITVGQYSEVFAASKLCRCFVTTTSDGQIAMIGTGGDIEYKTIHEAGAGHVFLFEDMDKDGEGEYIFIENGQAFIFKTNGDIISKPEIASDAGRKVGYIKDSPYGPLIYVFSSDGSELYLINKTGRILPDYQFPSSGTADVSGMKESDNLFITTAKGTTIYLHVVE